MSSRLPSATTEAFGSCHAWPTPTPRRPTSADIHAYTLRTWGPRQADAYLATLREGCKSTVERAPTASRLAHRQDEMFKLRCERHLIIFQRRPETVLIVRVLHERMDIDAQLAEP